MKSTGLHKQTLLDLLTLPYIRDAGGTVDVQRFSNRDELHIRFEDAKLKNGANRLHLKQQSSGILVSWWIELEHEDDADCVGQTVAKNIDQLRLQIEAQTGRVELKMEFDPAIA